MDVLQYIGSINKISLIAFIIVLCFLVYEVYVLKKDSEKKSKPVIPQFNPSIKVSSVTLKPEKQEVQKEEKFSTNKIIFIILIVMLILFGGLTVYSMVNPTNNAGKNQPQVIINTVSSQGIKLYDQSGKELLAKDLQAIKQGDSLRIGLLTIEGTDIDKARIRINSDLWQVTDITTNFDKTKNIYYIDHLIATGESKLKIDAQLHSTKDGWLGE